MNILSWENSSSRSKAMKDAVDVLSLLLLATGFDVLDIGNWIIAASYCWWFRNPAPLDIAVYTIIYDGFCDHPFGGFSRRVSEPSTDDHSRTIVQKLDQPPTKNDKSENDKSWMFPKIVVPQIIHSIGFSIINHPFWGTPIFGNTQLEFSKFQLTLSFPKSISSSTLLLLQLWGRSVFSSTCLPPIHPPKAWKFGTFKNSELPT